MIDLNILSVDWDYFFPCVDDFDWGHKESMLFIEALWIHRWSNRNLITGKYARDVVVPNESLLEFFWGGVVKVPPIKICIAESHAAIIDFMKMVQPSGAKTRWAVWNFDAHHDLGYGNGKALQCENWARIGISDGLIRSYNLVYPGWRRDEPEQDLYPGKIKSAQFSYHYKPPEHLPYFHCIFVCRSGAWTPSWHDDRWLTFIGGLKELDPMVWLSKAYQGIALKARAFDLQEAKRHAAWIDEQWNKHNQGGGQHG